MPNRKPKTLILCTDGISTRIIYNGISAEIETLAIIVEKKQSNRQLLRNRVKRLGLFSVFGQILFILFNKVMAKALRGKLQSLIRELEVSNSNLPSEKIINVSSINDAKVEELIARYNPELIIVNGTRVISKKILSATKAPFINTHMGITPRYRGVHGAYWALSQNDRINCGVTVHLVDPGIDTGGILYQETIPVSSEDNFNTYPIRQAQKAISLLKLAILDVQNNRITIKVNGLDSKLWFHPTLIQYLKNWIIKGVK